jgi:hypothetical protein
MGRLARATSFATTLRVIVSTIQREIHDCRVSWTWKGFHVIFKTFGGYTDLILLCCNTEHSRRVPVTAVTTALRTPNSDWREVASSSIKDKDNKEKKDEGGGVLREFMVDQRDTLRYMGAPLYCSDDFFDRRATYQVKTICSRVDACNGRMDGMRIPCWSSRKDEIRHARKLLQRSRPTAASWGVDGSIFHLP